MIKIKQIFKTTILVTFFAFFLAFTIEPISYLMEKILKLFITTDILGTYIWMAVSFFVSALTFSFLISLIDPIKTYFKKLY
jgi:TRAP-type C4-dicarboxylate transport system permease small subunit|tara:strand:- start:14708 stop:14950 length:243 start_codon:yes stop_codon:yes gene_type:complete